MNMKMNDILERYWQGESTLDEERFLRTYFRGDEIDPDHEPYRDLFLFFDREASIRYKAPEKKSVPEKIAGHRVWWRIAASVVVIVAAGVLLYQNMGQLNSPEDAWVKYEIQDPQQARDAAENALVFLSAKLNKGEVNVRQNLKTLDKLPFR
jgi:hypothetical protein